ncbi:cyclic AMP-responsive element-binding protein 5-like isoform X4 [Xiphophorus maculatus]|uniref:cyclic AMP-responsive element-binding protein 5-like isoform X4 n=1 Tax=Xiphophorus maculatus TaxID=8083 RepID=UPI000C6EA55F|nr:cyclic AMP-responsive element-binding protein 5-like isoform X4 [Xiphophorus maculatus]
MILPAVRVDDMNDKQDRPYVCGAPGCSQRFQLEEHLFIHRHKHEMTLKFPPIKTDISFSDQTPTPTRFLQNCEEVGLFKEIEEEFLQAQEEENNKQTLSHNGPSCMNQQHLKPQLQLQHPPQPPLNHPQGHGPMMAPSCSLAAQQALSCSSGASQSGSVITQAPSTLTHSGPTPGALSCLLQMRNRHRQPLPASLPGTLPDPAMQGASAQHMTLSPVAQQMQPSHSQHAAQASCSGSSSGGSGGGGGGTGGGSSRRRRSAEQDPDERRQKFLERNRAAATRCRQKRKLWVSSLEKKAEELTHTNLQLQNEVTSLRSEVGQLKQILLTHKDCPVTARQREAQGYPTAGVSPEGSPTPADPETQPHAIQHNSVSTSSTAGSDIGHGPLSGL